mgnify:CR=1 FL=1
MSSRKRYPVAPAPERFDEALEAGAAEDREDFGVRYRRLRDDFHGLPRGALRVEGRVIPDYPHIARIFALESGVAANFDDAFHVEEKIDGYNVRVFAAGGRPVAVTRSGRLCPFTCDRLPDLAPPGALEALFADHPELVLCAEVAGPGNPYMDVGSARVSEDVALFCFDLMRCGEQRFLPLADRDRLLAPYDIPQAPALGWFRPAQVEELRELVRRLDADGAEGIVLKAPGDGLRVKYVAPSINVEDVATEAALELELPGEFYSHRVVRMVMALRELGQRERVAELGAAFGRAMAEGFDRALDEVESSREIAKDYRVRLREETSIDALLSHLDRGSRTIKVRELERRRVGGHWELRLRKVFRRSSSKLSALIGGECVFD